MAEIQGQLVLAQNQHAFIQDATKGTVAVFAGPYSFSLSGNDRPVVYDKAKDAFVNVDIVRAITQNPLVPEGHYLVLDNPATDSKGELNTPHAGNNSPVNLQVGRKINIAGPTTFPLWPGQLAQVIPGHHLHSNQYLVVRVYNAEEANKNIPEFLKDGDKQFTPGQLLVIKGTDVSFFIPPTGFEVLKENESYVREALTLERLEYCILLDEDGNKRYEKGPQVVFPEATERFVEKTQGSEGNPSGGQKSRKFKAIELNDQMGLYVKVIADYKEGDKEYKTGDELFITGKQQRIYYPRPEHALIEYDDPTKGFKRQRYYGITIPKGEARYVLDKTEGDIKKVTGPQIFLPDPRVQVIVRRVLDDKTVRLWYPGNVEAAAFNETLRSLSDVSSNYLAEATVLSAAADVSRGMNRGTQYSKGLAGSFEGDTLKRGTKFTPPPMLTLNTKYDGVPAINVWTGYAVEVTNKNGDRRVEIGPTTILLDYDESLTVLELSTGKPKTTDTLHRDVYLRVDNNLVSDIINVETKDLVSVNFKVSYRVNFLRDAKDKWFSVENYVKFLCDHLRSLLKAKAKTLSVKEVIENSTNIIRDVVLGEKNGEGKRRRIFDENGMEVYDVEVLSVVIADDRIANLLKTAQTKAVESVISLSAEEQNLEATRRRVEIQGEIADLETNLSLKKEALTRQVAKAEADTTMAELEAEIATTVRKMEAAVAEQEQKTAISQAEFERVKVTGDYELSIEKARAELFEQKMKAITPNLIEAMLTLGQTEFATKLATAIAPLTLNEQQGLGTTLERVFKGTALETVLTNVQKKTAAKS